MPVEFVIRTADLRRAMDQLKVNRGQRNDSDFVDILVSECAATFRAVGTETEEPANGNRPGSVRIPLKTIGAINKVVNTFKKKELTFHCEPGVIKIESWSVKNPDIELGRVPDQRFGLPIDVSVLDTLAFAEIRTAEQLVEDGMRARVQEARETRASAVATALAALEPLGITERQLQDLIDDHVKRPSGFGRPLEFRNPLSGTGLRLRYEESEPDSRRPMYCGGLRTRPTNP